MNMILSAIVFFVRLICPMKLCLSEGDLRGPPPHIS